jgi:hypothetical protein
LVAGKPGTASAQNEAAFGIIHDDRCPMEFRLMTRRLRDIPVIS